MAEKVPSKTGSLEPNAIDEVTSIDVKLSPPELAELDRWRKSSGSDLSRPESIRRLVDLGVDHSPPGWASDGLSKYLDTAQRNRYGTFFRKRAEYLQLATIDRLLLELVEDWTDPQHSLELFLFFRASGAFRVSCQNALAGQVTESFVSCRNCIELAGYAAIIFKEPDLARVWLDRHESEEAKRAVLKSFTVRAMRDAVSAVCEKTAAVMSDLYETSIDFGAHPNERAIGASAHVEEVGDNIKMMQIQLHGKGVQLDFALKHTARVGLLVCEVAANMFPERALQIDYPARTRELRGSL